MQIFWSQAGTLLGTNMQLNDYTSGWFEITRCLLKRSEVLSEEVADQKDSRTVANHKVSKGIFLLLIKTILTPILPFCERELP